MTWSLVIGGVVAFVAASATVLWDCHVALKAKLKRVPKPIFTTPEALVFSGLCGAIAVVAFRYTNPQGTSVIDTILTLKQGNDYIRGLFVGVAILVLIRSKLTNIRGSDFGGELIYGGLKGVVLIRANERWGREKEAFIRKNLDTALSIDDFHIDLLNRVKEHIAVYDEELKVLVEGQLKSITEKQPSIPFDPQANEWRRYYRSVISLALDYTGKAPTNDLLLRAAQQKP